MTTPSTESVAATSGAGVAGRSRSGRVSSATTTTAVRIALDVSMAWLRVSGGITYVPAAEDASPGVGVVKLGARHLGRRRQLVDLGGEQHAQQRRREVDPE